MQCHGSGKKRALHLKQAIGSGILPPDAWHAALAESNTVNHFKKEFFLRKKITLFLEKPKLHLVPPSPVRRLQKTAHENIMASKRMYEGNGESV